MESSKARDPRALAEIHPWAVQVIPADLLEEIPDDTLEIMHGVLEWNGWEHLSQVPRDLDLFDLFAGQGNFAASWNNAGQVAAQARGLV